MKTVLRVAIVLLFVCQTLSMYGQGASVAVDKDRKAWLGFNVGGFWQGSDIRPASSAGSSLIFDYYFIRNNTSVFGIGVRGQYLKATSLGQGITRDYNIQNNLSLNGSSGNPDYASLGSGKDYVFQNYSTDITDLSGNVIISLNRLRAVSRINLYVFGGIGGTGYIASMNQRDASGNLYDYDLINSSGKKSAIKDGLKELRDDTYETYGEGGSSRSWAFTPTVGAGFGIQLSSRVQLAFEHKVGFTGTDLLDGNRYGTSNSRNDIYHYSSFGVNFGLGKPIGGGPAVTKAPPRRTPVLPVTPTEPTVNAPVIRITSPASTSVTVEKCNASITATVENVTSRQDIAIVQDRTPIDFEFSARTITVSSISFTGTTNFVITAKNSAGIATQSVSFTCQPPVEMITICHRVTGQNPQTISIPAIEWSAHQAHGDTQGECPVIQRPRVLPPVITIATPATSPITVDDCTASIVATVENINDKQGIAIFRDRTPVAYEFSGNKITVSNVNFIGTANFIITAKNTAGTATQTVTFICRPPARTITICHLEAGQNPQSIDIPITEWPTHQAHGDTQGACPVIQTPALQPPVVTITAPATSPLVVENCKASITATIDNIAAKEGITVTKNQTAVAFEFTNSTVSIANVDFTGTANFVITATNSAGTATQTASFVCQPPVQMITICHRESGQSPQELSIPATEWPAHQAHGDTQGACPVVQPPVVTITAPATSPLTVENCKASITASIENITAKEGITVTQNQTAVAFEFANNTVTVTDVDFTGTANFVITATNSAGTATKTVSFVCQPPVQMITICHRESGQSPQELSIPVTEWATHQAHGDTQGACPVIQAPVVTITAPATSPLTVENCKASITATVENITAKEGISVTLNQTAVAFEFANNTVTVTDVDFTGTANFVITATNSAGSATQTASFVCQPPVQMITICHRESGQSPQELSIPVTEWATHQAHGDTQGACPVIQAPVVTITAPATSPLTVENCKASITATIENIAAKEGITVTQNQSAVAFEFTNNTVTITDVDFTGTANFVITATNSAGTATQTASFVCQPPVQMITICHRESGQSPQELSIPASEWPAHQAHGDTQGACPVVQPPVVTITAPATSPLTVENCKASITASIENITAKEGITVTQNQTAVAFEFTNSTVSIANVDFTGTANFVITATNSAGTATQTASFVCQPPVQMITICHRESGQSPQELSIPVSEWAIHQGHGDTQGACPVVQPPVVTITAPATSPLTVENCKASITATIENIIAKEGITVTQDQTAVAFEFANNTVTVTDVDFTGTANFVITATNSAGTATQTASFVCQPKQITICHIPPGNNGNPQTITIAESAWPAHQAHGDTQGVCPVIQPPVVTITTPATSPRTVENCKASITATVENITAKEGITVTQNQTAVAFEFANNTVTVTDVDFTGTANFVITATNSAGTATQTASFVCQPKQITICHIPPGNNGNPQTITIAESAWPAHQAHGDTQGACPVVQPPVVTITAPATSPLTVENCKASITATIENITVNEGITVTQNQTAVAFEFTNNTVTVTDVDFTGTANFVIKATNSAGTATQTASFVCQPKQITICHIPPGNNGNPQTITIAESAWPAHQAHGDTQGACVPAQTPADNDKSKDKEEKSEKEVGEKSITEEEEKITICHHPPGNRPNFQTLTIPISAWPAHEKHGDTKGSCKD